MKIQVQLTKNNKTVTNDIPDRITLIEVCKLADNLANNADYDTVTILVDGEPYQTTER